jgi:hypothetical protein
MNISGGTTYLNEGRAGLVRRSDEVIPATLPGRVINHYERVRLLFMAHHEIGGTGKIGRDRGIGYRNPKKTFPHATIDHAQRQYVVGAVHTNTIEGFWSIIKRGIVGTLHNVSKKYPHLYVAKVQFRYNNRFNDDIFGTAIEGVWDFAA